MNRVHCGTLVLALLCACVPVAADNPGAEDGAARFGSRYQLVKFYSTTIGASGWLYVLKPKDYDLPANTGKTYHVLFTFDSEQSKHFIDAAEALAELNLIDPVMIVGLGMVNMSNETYGLQREGWLGLYVNRMADYIADELIPYFRATYRIKPGIRAFATAGHSLGGHAAFFAAWYRYDAIGGCAAHSGTASVSYHWGYPHYNNAAKWKQFSQRPVGDATWSASYGVGTDIRTWPAYDNSGGARTNNLRLFLECGVTENANAASRADSAGDWAAVGCALLSNGWEFGRAVAHYDSSAYHEHNTAHYYEKQEQAAWSSLYFLFRKTDLQLTSVQIIPKRVYTYEGYGLLSMQTGHEPGANRIDVRRGSTRDVELRVHFGPYCQMTYPDWRSLTVDNTNVATLSGINHQYLNLRPWPYGPSSPAGTAAYYAAWGLLTGGAADGTTMLRGTVSYLGTNYAVSAGINVYNTTEPAVPAAGEAGGPRGGANRLPAALHSAWVAPSHTAIAGVLPGDDPDGDALAVRTGASLTFHYASSSNASFGYESAGAGGAWRHLGHLILTNPATRAFVIYPYDAVGRAPYIYCAHDGGLESYSSVAVVHFGHPTAKLNANAVAFAMEVGGAGHAVPAQHALALSNSELNNPIDGNAMAPTLACSTAWLHAVLLGTTTPYTVQLTLDETAANSLPMGSYTGSISVSPGVKTVLLPEADTWLSTYPQGWSRSVGTSGAIKLPMRWDVTGISGTVHKALLRVYAKLINTQDVTVCTLADDSWDEYAVKQATYTPLAAGTAGVWTAGATAGRWYNLDVTGYIEAERLADGHASFCLDKKAGSGNSDIYFREHVDYSPELIVISEGSAPAACTTSAKVVLTVMPEPAMLACAGLLALLPLRRRRLASLALAALIVMPRAAHALESGDFYVPDVALDEGRPLTGCVMPYPAATIELYALAYEFSALTFNLNMNFIRSREATLANAIKRPEVIGLPTTHGNFSLNGDVTYINGRIHNYITLGAQQHNSPREIDLAYWYSSYHDSIGYPSRNNLYHRFPVLREIGAFDRYSNANGDAHWLAYQHVKTARSLNYPTTLHVSFPGDHGLTGDGALDLDYTFLMDSIRHRLPELNRTNGVTQLRPVSDRAPGSWYTTARLYTNNVNSVYGVPIWLDQTEIFPAEELTNNPVNYFWEPSRRSAERWLAYHRVGRFDGRTNMTITRTFSGVTHHFGARNAKPPVRWGFLKRYNLPPASTLSLNSQSDSRVASFSATEGTSYWYEIWAADASGQTSTFRDAIGYYAHMGSGYNTSPKAAIVSPPRCGITVPKGYPLTLRVLMTDAEDGANILPGTNNPATWESSLDGDIGWGGELVVSNLSEGRHIILARVLDSRGGKDNDVTYLTVTDTNGHLNTPPAPADDLYQIGTNETLTRTAADGVLSNDYDADGDGLQCYLAMGGASYGRVTLADDGAFTYVPSNGFVGADYFYYGLTDGRGRAYHFGRVRVLVGTTLPDTAGQGSLCFTHDGPPIGYWRILGSTEWVSDEGVLARLSTNGNPYAVEFGAVKDFAYAYDAGADVYQDWYTPKLFGTWQGGTALVNVIADQCVTGSFSYGYAPASTPVGNVTALVGPAAATNAGARWRIRRDYFPQTPTTSYTTYTPSAPVSGWLESGRVVSNLPVHTITNFRYVLEYSVIKGWTAPGDVVIPFGAGSNMLYAGSYAPDTTYTPPRVVTDQRYVFADEGATNHVALRLDGAPTGPVSVALSRTGDVSVAIVSSTSLSFHTNTWDTWQTVTVFVAENNANAESGLGLVIARVVGAPLDPKTLITVIERDDDFRLSVTNHGIGTTIPAGAVFFETPTNYSIIAVPRLDSVFEQWLGDTQFVADVLAPTTSVHVAHNVSLTAVFLLPEPALWALAVLALVHGIRGHGRTCQ